MPTRPTVRAEQSPAQQLRQSAAAVRVHFTWWGIHRTLTAQQKEEVGATYAADVRFVTAGKKLIDTQHEAFRRLTSLRSRIITFWRGMSLPYTEPGIRLLRQTDVQTFVQTMEGLQQELAQAEAELNEVFEALKSDARRRLGRLYNPADYPTEMQGLFACSWDFPSIEPPSYLLQLNPELYQQEQERVTRRFEEAIQLAEQAFIAEFARLVSHLTERLSGSDGEKRIFRDSAVTNLSEFFQRFQHLSVRSNEDLDQLVAQAQQLVRGVSPQELRDNTGLRQHIASEMTSLQVGLEGMMIDRPRRRLIRPSSNGEAHAVMD